MKKLRLIFLGILLPLCAMAQQQGEYNRRGDEAFNRKDYLDAQMWYEIGLANCDKHSIAQLTAIWQEDENMRRTMHDLMAKCLDCLTDMAALNDTTAIRQLIIYHKEGIGTSKSDEQATIWEDRIIALQTPISVYPTHEPMHFFAGYAFSIEAPFGVTIGGVWDRFGWYARFKTNFSFQNHSYETDDYSNILPKPTNTSTEYDSSKGMKTNTYIATAGAVFKIISPLYASVGFGYGERALLSPFILRDYSSSNEVKKEVWAYNIDSSYKGVAAEVDLMYTFKNLFVSAGCSTINFKYIDLNAGVGLFF
jgi:hypothetical protein